MLGFKGWFCAQCNKVHDRTGHAAAPAEAAARQEPPPKCLVMYAEGVAEAGELEAVHGAARDGCCGFVALRVPPDAELACGDDAVSARNVAQLLDCASPSSATPLAQRFKGLRAAVLSATPDVRAVAVQAGACAVELPAPANGADISGALAAQLRRLLGLSADDEPLEQPAYDLALLHLRPAGVAPWNPPDATALAETLDAVLRALRTCPAVAQQLYLLVLLGRCSTAVAPDPCRAPPPSARLPAHLAHLLPEQSFRASLGAGAADEHALLCIHCLEAVVRRDDAACASAVEFAARGARGTVLADDVLHELAYKLARAPKYGA